MTTEVAGSSPAPTQEAQTAGATTNDFSAQQWAAAAAMQQYYGVNKPLAPAANNAAGAAQYYAQMAQHPQPIRADVGDTGASPVASDPPDIFIPSSTHLVSRVTKHRLTHLVSRLLHTQSMAGAPFPGAANGFGYPGAMGYPRSRRGCRSGRVSRSVSRSRR